MDAAAAAFSEGDRVVAVAAIGSSMGLSTTVRPGDIGTVVQIHPPGVWLGPTTGQDYRLRVRFDNHVNLCPCGDGAYHTREVEVTKVGAPTLESIQETTEEAS